MACSRVVPRTCHILADVILHFAHESASTFDGKRRNGWRRWSFSQRSRRPVALEPQRLRKCSIDGISLGRKHRHVALSSGHVQHPLRRLPALTHVHRDLQPHHVLLRRLLLASLRLLLRSLLLFLLLGNVYFRQLDHLLHYLFLRELWQFERALPLLLCLLNGINHIVVL